MVTSYLLIETFVLYVCHDEDYCLYRAQLWGPHICIQGLASQRAVVSQRV